MQRSQLLRRIVLTALLCALSTVAAPAAAKGRRGEQRTVLVYPGSFDIFHATHLAELKSALKQVRRAEGDVKGVVLPNHDRPKHLPEGRTRYIFDARQRTGLARAATRSVDGVSVQRPFAQGTETVEQLLSIVGKQVAKSGKRRVAVLLGEDAFRGMREWKGFRRLLPKLDIYVSVAPKRLTKLGAPETILGKAAQRYRVDGSQRYTDPKTGQRIQYLGIEVPRIRSHALLGKLAAGLKAGRELPLAERRELRKPLYSGVLRHLRRNGVVQRAALKKERPRLRGSLIKRKRR
jgi:nicotinic acid mononucleotide adenylyltransferase